MNIREKIAIKRDAAKNQKTKLGQKISSFLTRRRYAGKYPRVKRAILAITMSIICAHIWYGVIDTAKHTLSVRYHITLTREGENNSWGARSTAHAQEAVPSEEARTETNGSLAGGGEEAQASSNQNIFGMGEFSAYNSEENQTDSDPFIMASGKWVYDGAVANNCLPFGTKIKVNGKVKVVEDRMNSRYGCEHFDIWMEKYDDAIAFGRKTMTYEVIN